jgi:hypothetical protein
MIAVHKELKFKVKVTRLNKDKFTGTVTESDSIIYPISYYGTSFDSSQYSFYSEPGDYGYKTEVETSDLKTPKHYDNSKGSLYKFSEEKQLNSYEFEVVKRIIRCRKKGEFISDIEKTIKVLQIYLEEQGEKYKGQFEPLNK